MSRNPQPLSARMREYGSFAHVSPASVMGWADEVEKLELDMYRWQRACEANARMVRASERTVKRRGYTR